MQQIAAKVLDPRWKMVPRLCKGIRKQNHDWASAPFGKTDNEDDSEGNDMDNTARKWIDHSCNEV